ncbi:hypothetical protein JHD50_05480 [Sulfurimonas sp. MAG313]|nr:hypothetical protein [Sulfurimonas sp. MAG313]MDF1880759.1 hypothetical protein [Sulfurimonas sp. MAG313]
MTYDLKAILSSVSSFKKNNDKSKQVKKRLLFDQAPVGGLSVKWFWLTFIAMPFIEYGVIFNPVIFPMLGIAQAIVFFVVFLSIVMILIYALYAFNNRSVIDKIRPLWKAYFPEIELELILTSSHSPYSNFFNEYALMAGDELNDNELHEKMKEAIKRMQEDNKDLLEAMNRSKN